MARSRQTNPRRAGEAAKSSAPSAGSRAPGLEHLRVRAPQQALRPQGVAAMRERDHHSEARSDERVELALGLGHAPRRESRPLRFERELLAAGKRVELGAVRFEIDAELVSPDLEHLGGPPHEVGLPGERVRLARVEVTRPRPRSARRSPAGKMTARSSSRSARCVNGENARTPSTTSPKSSTRIGSRPVVPKTSRMPPRTAIWPRSSTRSTRSYPASTSASPSSSSALTWPTTISTGAARSLSGGNPSAAAAAEMHTRPPASSTESARSRSPTR